MSIVSRWAIDIAVLEYWVDEDTDVPVGVSTRRDRTYCGSLTREQAERVYRAANDALEQEQQEAKETP